MAGGLEELEDEGLSGINVVPLVDIMLVLLIIFMVSTEFVQQELQNKRSLSRANKTLDSAFLTEVGQQTLGTRLGLDF